MTRFAATVAIDADRLAGRFETWSARDVVAWGLGTFAGRICVAASMADTVLVHLATTVDPDVEVVFLDTGFHFSETIVTLRRAHARYGFDLRVERPDPQAPDLFAAGTEACCAARKRTLLDRALAGKDAWMTGLRRSEADTRRATPVISVDGRGLVKLAPLATWSDDDVGGYVAEHDLVVNPLSSEGYPSIGCWPCTEPVVDGEDPRAGRWRGTAKTECGLHL